MAEHPQQQKSGKPWSGTNKIPNIQEFVSNLDKDKAKRDKDIDQQVGASNKQDKVTPHKNEKREEKGKTVTDPVTGRQVVIADVGKKYMKNVDNPQVSFLSIDSFAWI
jgi:hypothetical protein